MSDPVWLGNIVVARWQALALLLGGGGALLVAALVGMACVRAIYRYAVGWRTKRET